MRAEIRHDCFLAIEHQRFRASIPQSEELRFGSIEIWMALLGMSEEECVSFIEGRFSNLIRYY